MASAVLIQYASGTEHCAMLDLTRGLHRRYCERWGADYHCDHGDIDDGRTRHWRKIGLIGEALAAGYRKVIWLDCDAVIVDPAVDLFGLVGFGIAVCECFDSPSIERHLNTGVIWAIDAPAVRDFIAQWDATPRDASNGWQDQNAFIQLMARRPHRDLLTILPNRFNCVETHMEARDPVIRHFAGDPGRLTKIERLVATITG